MDFGGNPPKLQGSTLGRRKFGFCRDREASAVWVARAETRAIESPGRDLSKTGVSFPGALTKTGQPMAPKSKNHENSVNGRTPGPAGPCLLNCKFYDFSISAPSAVRT